MTSPLLPESPAWRQQVAGPRAASSVVRQENVFLSFSFQSELLQESNLIMAKVNYVEGDYKEALNIYARVGLDDLPLAAVPPYRLRLLAEAYATKGEACAVPGRVSPGACRLEPRSLPGACSSTPVPLAGDQLCRLPARPPRGPHGWSVSLKPSGMAFPRAAGPDDHRRK